MTKPEASMDFIFCFRYLLSKQFYSIVFCMDRSSEIMKRALIESILTIFKSKNGQRSMEAYIETDNGLAKSIHSACWEEWQAGYLR